MFAFFFLAQLIFMICFFRARNRGFLKKLGPKMESQRLVSWLIFFFPKAFSLVCSPQRKYLRELTCSGGWTMGEVLEKGFHVQTDHFSGFCFVIKEYLHAKCMALFLMTLWEISLSKIGLFSNGTNTVASSHRGKKKEEDFLFFNQKERFLKAFFQMQNGHRKLLLYVFLQVWNGLADAFIVETWRLDFKKLFRPFLLFT